MQAEREVVDVLGTLGVELQNGFVFVPKHVFDLAHFFPRRAAGWRADGDVFPFAKRVVPVFAAADDAEFMVAGNG